ncbi:MAG: SDR family NAD(P)-dependent oxidoreductase [Chloroflexi bacterium]|nr:SDR family NAD(P)-dependent oxidoreductase [Chloroflexota bacterium]
MANKLEGKCAVVTGAGRGIGRAIALELAKEGAKVVVSDLGTSKSGEGTDASPSETVVTEIRKAGGVAIANTGSVADFEAAGRMIRSCIDAFGRIDILVNCAGILRDRMIHKMSEAEWDAVIGVHLKGTFNTIRHAVPYMREQKSGRIINTTSESWLGVVAGQANYASAKGGIVSLTREVAGELKAFGVTVNAIAPMAATRMNMSDDVIANYKKMLESKVITQEIYDEMMNMPGPEFLAPVVAYLATDQAAGISGKVIACGGGKVALYSEPVVSRAIFKDYRKEGPWTVDDLIRLVPGTLLA